MEKPAKASVNNMSFLGSCFQTTWDPEGWTDILEVFLDLVVLVKVLDIAAHTWDPSIGETEAEGFQWVGGNLDYIVKFQACLGYRVRPSQK